MEKFFLIGCQVDEIELKEILLRRYGRFTFYDMSCNEFLAFIKLVLEKEKKDKAEKLYLVLVPKLIEINKFMSFDQFYDEISGANLDLRPAEDILRESEEIEKRLRGDS